MQNGTGSSVNSIEGSGDSVDPETGVTDATASDSPQMALPHPLRSAYSLLVATLLTEGLYLLFSGVPSLRFAGAVGGAVAGGSTCQFTPDGAIPSEQVMESPVFWIVSLLALSDVVNTILAVGAEPYGPMEVEGEKAVPDVPWLRRFILAAFSVAGCSSLDGAAFLVTPDSPLSARLAVTAVGALLAVATAGLYVMTYPMAKALERYHNLGGFFGLWKDTSWQAKLRIIAGTIFRAASVGFSLQQVANSITRVLGDSVAPDEVTTSLTVLGAIAGVGLNLPTALSDATADKEVRDTAARAGKSGPSTLELLLGNALIPPGEAGHRDCADYMAQGLFFSSWALRVLATAAFLYAVSALGSSNPELCTDASVDVPSDFAALIGASAVAIIVGVLAALNRQSALKEDVAEGLKTIFGCLPRCSRESEKWAVTRLDGTVPTKKDMVKAETDLRARVYEAACGLGCSRPPQSGLASQGDGRGYGAAGAAISASSSGARVSGGGTAVAPASTAVKPGSEEIDTTPGTEPTQSWCTAIWNATFGCCSRRGTAAGYASMG
jgi:hypothetical protein